MKNEILTIQLARLKKTNNFISTINKSRNINSDKSSLIYTENLDAENVLNRVNCKVNL